MSDTPHNQAAEPAPAFWEVPGMHSLVFQRNRSTGDFRAMCTCGWARVGRDEKSIRNQAATHDIDWVDVLNATRFPTAQS